KLSSETRQRVFDAARRLGYIAPLSGANLRSEATPQIGFVVDQLATSPEAAIAIDGINTAARSNGMIVMVAQTSNDPLVQSRVVRAFKDQRASWLVYMTIFTREVELPPEILALDIPVFLLNCYTENQSHPAVVPSEIAGG